MICFFYSRPAPRAKGTRIFPSLLERRGPSPIFFPVLLSHTLPPLRTPPWLPAAHALPLSCQMVVSFFRAGFGLSLTDRQPPPASLFFFIHVAFPSARRRLAPGKPPPAFLKGPILVVPYSAQSGFPFSERCSDNVLWFLRASLFQDDHPDLGRVGASDDVEEGQF